MNGNLVEPVSTFDARQARFFMPDRNPPYVMDFDLEFNKIRVEFNETVNVSTFDPAHY